MPVTTRKSSKIDPDQVYVAKDSVSYGITVIPAGERRRGSDPLVYEHPSHWVPDGVPVMRPGPDVLPAPKRQRAEHDVIVYEALVPLDALVLRRPLRVAHAQHDNITELPAGTVIARDAELPRILPDDAFEDPVKR